MTEENRKCETCSYCVRYEFPNIDKQLISNNQFKDLLPDKLVFYKCHIQGPPKNINVKYDWCYQWKEKK